MDTVLDTESAWSKAQEAYLASLKPDQIRHVRCITTQNELLSTTMEYRRRYNSAGLAKQLDRVNPFLAQIHSFSDIVKTYASAGSKITAVVWGSVAFVLEVVYLFQYVETVDFQLRDSLYYSQLALRHTHSLELMVEAFESFDRYLPFFPLYLAEYGSRPITHSSKKGLVEYYTELIGLCQDSISFLGKSALSMASLSTSISQAHPI